MYPNGVVIGSTESASFPPNEAHQNLQKVGYGNLYFFFDRSNITKAFPPNRELSSSEEYYATLYQSGGADTFYSSVTTINFDYAGSGDADNEQYYERKLSQWYSAKALILNFKALSVFAVVAFTDNPYNWNAKMANHDMTDGWELPPNCEQEGEAFFGIPLSRSSDSKLTQTTSFQDQFDFEYLLDRNFTYMQKFGTNHGWLVGEQIGNGAGSIVDKDTAHIPIFYTGTTNPDMVRMENIAVFHHLTTVRDASYSACSPPQYFACREECLYQI